MTDTFIHSLNKYLLSTHFVASIDLRTGGTAVDDTGRSLYHGNYNLED